VEQNRYSKYITINTASYKALNKLEQNDILNGKKKRECQAGTYIDRALELLVEKEGLIIE